MNKTIKTKILNKLDKIHDFFIDKSVYLYSVSTALLLISVYYLSNSTIISSNFKFSISFTLISAFVCFGMIIYTISCKQKDKNTILEEPNAALISILLMVLSALFSCLTYYS